MRFLIVILGLVLLVGCRSDESGARIMMKHEDVPIFISGPIKVVDFAYEGRLSVPLGNQDADALGEAMREIQRINVDLYFGESFYGEMVLLDGEDFSELIIPYHDGSEEIFEREGIRFGK